MLITWTSEIKTNTVATRHKQKLIVKLCVFFTNFYQLNNPVVVLENEKKKVGKEILILKCDVQVTIGKICF